METYRKLPRNLIAISALSLVALSSCGSENEAELIEVNQGAIHDEVKALYPEAEDIRITGGENYGIGGAVVWDMPQNTTCSAFVIRNAHKIQSGNVLATEPYCRDTVKP